MFGHYEVFMRILSSHHMRKHNLECHAYFLATRVCSIKAHLTHILPYSATRISHAISLCVNENHKKGIGTRKKSWIGKNGLQPIKATESKPLMHESHLDFTALISKI